MPFQSTCLVCGKAFSREPSRAGPFCSRPCTDIGRRRPISERFWSKVDKSGDCWLWTGATFKGTGYGKIHTTGKNGMGYAHRKAWEFATGVELASDDFVCHTCDTPACVRNDQPGFYNAGGILLPSYGHLFRGTVADNSRDMFAKGRNRNRSGSAH